MHNYYAKLFNNHAKLFNNYAKLFNNFQNIKQILMFNSFENCLIVLKMLPSFGLLLTIIAKLT